MPDTGGRDALRRGVNLELLCCCGARGGSSDTAIWRLRSVILEISLVRSKTAKSNRA